MYKLEQKLLNNYAKVMVHYGINGGKGIKSGETVLLVGPECSKDLFLEIAKEIWLAAGNVIMRYLPDEISMYGANRFLLEVGTDEQLTFSPNPFWQGLTDVIDHLVFIIADPDVHALEGIPAEKISKINSSRTAFMKMRDKKECEGKFSWTLCLYGTQSMADEAGLSLEEYWEQIIEACYLRDPDPVLRWKQTQNQVNQIKNKLDELQIERVHIQGEDVDLHVLLGDNRKWLGGTGRNIPSFEVFISPDWRGTHGSISFNQPLYYSGKKISGIKLEFEKGIVIKTNATENHDALIEMIANENANKVGEFSLTDRRHSRITKFMATTLFDENAGGEYGNTHIALGNSYKDSYPGDKKNTTKEEWASMGYNECTKVHTDIISTTNRKVTATLKNGEKVVIYENGQFTMI